MVRVGKIVATHGLKGTVVMTHVLGNKKWLKKGHALHVEMLKGSYIPYFVAGCKAAADGEYLVDMEDMATQAEGKRLVTKFVYVDEGLLQPYAAESPLLWIGFKVIDKAAGVIGDIDDVMQTGSQWLARIMQGEKEILVPLIPQTVDKVLLKTKTIEMTLPEGLLEVYLG